MAPQEPTSGAPGNPLADALRRAIAAHPILRDQKKLVVVTPGGAAGGAVRLEGSVFTRDMLRQLTELVARLPGGEHVRLAVDTDVRPPQDRKTVGKVPVPSQGPSSVDRGYSVRHVRRP
jgi:hypothetical protein